MSSILTEAGVKLCLSIGVLNPTYESCQTPLWQLMHPNDSFWQSVATQISIPDDRKSEKDFIDWDGCVAYAKYDIYDGTKGTNYFCYRSATLQWIPEAGRWKYSFPNHRN